MSNFTTTTCLSSDKFTFTRDSEHSKRLTATCFASDLGPLSQGLFWLNKIYANKPYRGIAIKSEKTGAVVVYQLTRTEKDADGDVVAWYFLVASERERAKCNGCTGVIIYND